MALYETTRYGSFQKFCNIIWQTTRQYSNERRFPEGLLCSWPSLLICSRSRLSTPLYFSPDALSILGASGDSIPSHRDSKPGSISANGTHANAADFRHTLSSVLKHGVALDP